MVKKIALYALIGSLSVILLGLILLPFVVPSIIEKNSKEWIGRSVSLEKMGINYFTGTVRLYDFDLYEKDDSTTFVGFDTLIIDTEPYMLFSKTFVIEQFYLQGLFVDVIMYESGFNFDDMLTHGSDSTAAPEEEEPPTDSEPMKFELSNIELSDATFIIQDAVIQDSIEMDEFNFFLPFLAWNQQGDSEADLRFDFKNDGYFESTLDYNPNNKDFKVDFTLGNYQISGYQEFAAKYVDVGKFVGIIDVHLNLEGNIEQPIQTNAASRFLLSDFALYDEKDSVMFGLEQFTFDLAEANMDTRNILIDSIHLLKPSVYFEAYDSTSNVAEFMNRVMPPEDTVQQEDVNYEMVSQEYPEQEEMTEETMAEDTTNQYFISINNVLLDSGEVRLADYNQERSFEYKISNIQVMTDSVTSDSDWLVAEISMHLSDRGKMESDVFLNMTNPEEITMDMTISNLMLEDFDVYCREGTGYPLIYGDMFLKSHTEVRNDTMKSQNDIVIHNMKLGKRERAIGPPLKTAMFLLKDKDRVVHIDMPVEGPVGESGTDIAKMFWDQFSGLLVKVASTPFKFLGSVLNVFDTDIKHINYDYMDSTFTRKKERQLNSLLKVEDHDEEVKIDLIYYKDSLLERQKIAMQLVGQEFGETKWKRNKSRFKDYVESKIKTDTLSLEEACLQLADRSKVDAISAEYDSARFRSLRNYLYSQRDTTSITLYYSREPAPNNEDRKPRFEVKIGMKDDSIEEKYVDR